MPIQPYNSWDQNYINHHEVLRLNQNYEHELRLKPVPIDQKKTGLCWLYAGLNCMRHCIIDKYNLPLDFEFSINYLLFWDKYEKCKYFLKNYKNVMENEDFITKQIFLKYPIIDGGQWHMFANLVNKYGILPKTAYNNTFATTDTTHLNMVLNHILKDAVLNNIQAEKVMISIYDILISYLGTPPSNFTWYFKTNSDEFKKIENLTPHIFYNSYVNFDVNDYISIVNDPRNELYEYYTSDYFNNMYNTPTLLNLNLPMSEIISYTQKSIKSNTPVWIGCDIKKYGSDYYCLHGNSFFSDPFLNKLSKKQRLISYDSLLNHAMVCHSYTEQNNRIYWQFENSWGSKSIYGGYHISDNGWFNNYVFQAIIPKKHMKPQTNQQMKKKVRKLPLWDSFARHTMYKVKCV